MGGSIVCDPDPQHSHGLQIISGVEDNRRAKWDYRNGTGMVDLMPHPYLRIPEGLKSGLKAPMP